MSEVATVGRLKSASSKRDLSLLSDGELEKRATRRDRVSDFFGFGSLVPVIAAFPVSHIVSDGLPILFLMGIGAASLVGGIVIDRRSASYWNTLKSRKSEEKKTELESWQAATIAELKDRFAIDFEIEDLQGLKYPREAPTTKSTVRYGTIEKLIEDPEGEGARLEQLTLIWSNGEPRILRAVTELRDIHGGVLR